MPSSMSAFGTTLSSVTAVPSSSRSPSVSRPVIFTLASSSPSSTSEKPKSDTWNVYVASSTVVTVPDAAVGASFTAVTSTVMV